MNFFTMHLVHMIWLRVSCIAQVMFDQEAKSISMFDSSKLPLEISKSTFWVNWKCAVSLNEVVTTFEITLGAAKFETCIPCIVAIYAYPALQLMQVKVLPMKFWRWKLCGWLIDHENHENYTPQNFVNILYLCV